MRTLFLLLLMLGHGDVSDHMADSKVATPNIERLAGEGMPFTDAHRPATICRPSRCSLMTGQMAFRAAHTLSIRRLPWRHLNRRQSGGSNNDGSKLRPLALQATGREDPAGPANPSTRVEAPQPRHDSRLPF